MKLKASEAVFIAICLIAAAAAVWAAAFTRERGEGAVKVSLAESEQEAYDVAVLNDASAEDFMQIRGIGEVRARAIVEYRTAIGGFKRVGQLRDISGISDSTLALIIEHFYGEGDKHPASNVTAADEPLSVPETKTEKTEPTAPSVTTAPPETTGETSAPVERVMREVNINFATAEEIADALLIEPELAAKIVELRERIEYFSSVQELYLCDGFNDKIYEKVKNYVKMSE